ncbi:MAG: hypothetical protein ACPGGB_01435 [Flavobacteriales bacterium]
MRSNRVAPIGLKALQGALLLLGLWGCSVIGEDQDIPRYLVVPDVTFTPDELQGTASVNITDLWVYSATDVVGVFPLPAVVPLLPGDMENGSVRLLAGIRENGLSDRRAPYPFYTAFEQEAFPEPGFRDTLQPGVELVEDVRLIRVEDFETSNVFGSMIGGQGLIRVDAAGQVFEGEESGRIEVQTGAEAVRVRTVEQEYDLENGAPAFLEMDYRCDQPFAVGLFGFRDGQEWQQPAMVLTATDDGLDPVWNKIYIDLAPLVTAQGVADHFEVYFECFLEAGRATGTVGVDNIRILTY